MSEARHIDQRYLIDESAICCGQLYRKLYSSLAAPISTCVVNIIYFPMISNTLFNTTVDSMSENGEIRHLTMVVIVYFRK